MTDLQPDFLITVNGADVTKHVESWRLRDSEEGKSSIEVTLQNEDQKLSGQFEADQELSIIYGYHGNLSDPCSMEIKNYSERLSIGGAVIDMTALDCTERLTGNTMRGKFDTDDTRDVIRDTAKSCGIDAEVGDMESCKFPKDYKPQVHNERADHILQRHMEMSGNPKKKSARDLKIRGQKDGKEIGSFKGQVGQGMKSARGPLTKDLESDYDNWVKNHLDQQTEKAASISMTANLEMIGDPSVKAKTCIIVLNVGPKASGKWYIKSANHAWSVSGGYTTSLDLIRPDGGCPLVSYAKIYEKNRMYVGPRKLDDDSGTFDWGREPYKLREFSWSEDTTSGKCAGEGADAHSSLYDSLEKTLRIEQGKDKGGE